MRLLVACPQCKRQFDASGRPVGARFRCPCGAVVTIRRPEGHDAAVVRCSACGAPREEGSAACHYCGANFTVHERDLDTVCPQCLARISDQARFCHHCGIALCPEPPLGEKTRLACPACGESSQLDHRQLGDTALLECRRCGGFWVASGVFEHLIEKASRDALGVDWDLQSPAHPSTAAGAPRPGPMYRHCPVCGKLMGRRNYAHRSGVIIDACKDHGVWFDAGELPRILAWVRSGGLAEAHRQMAADAEHQEKIESIVQTIWQRWKHEQ